MTGPRAAQPNQAGRSRRAQIVRCAIDALCAVGYGGASVGEIARRAGVSKGVVSYHFADKDALLAQVVLDLYSEAGDRIQERVEAAPVPAEALRGYLEANLDVIAERPRHVRAATEVIADLRRRHDATASTDPVTDHLTNLLRSGQQAGQFGDFDCRSVAMILRAAIDTAAQYVVADPAFDLPAYREQLIDLADRLTPAGSSEGT